MSENTADIAGLVAVLVEPIVDYPDDLKIEQTVEEGGDILIEIQVNDADTGKVIGRGGRVIKSIRTLARAAASRTHTRVEVEIVD